MAMLMSVMPKTLQILTDCSVTVSTTPVEGHVITVVQVSINYHGNQLLLTVPMNVNLAIAMAMPMTAIMIQRFIAARPAKILTANLKEEVSASTVSIIQQASIVRDAVRDIISLQIIQ